jgi:WYL_2, Sm-like SH3 beta-barrel fold
MINWADPNNLIEIDDRVEPMLHEWLNNMLKVTEATITFTKVDGTERVMKCTLEATKLPPIVIKEDAKPRKETTSTKALRVFDIEKNEWRSFTIKNIKRIELSLT